MTKSAIVSECGRYRYRLGRVWDDSLPCCCWVMLNPSTADADVDDPTVRRCVGFAERMGCGSIDVRNLFALRSSKPTVLIGNPSAVGPDNDELHLRTLPRDGLIVCGWGAMQVAIPRARRFVKMAAEEMLPLSCLGRTAAGAPRHPLYLPGDAPLTVYP